MKGAISRRHFLTRATTAAALGAPLFDLPRVLRAAAANDLKDLAIGVQSYSLRKFDAVRAIRIVQGIGVHHMEFYSGHFSPNSTPQQISEMRGLVGAANISISAHGVDGFTKNHEANQVIFEFARWAGIRNITANPQPDSFNSLEKLVSEYNIRICIHNDGPGSMYDKLQSVTKAVKGRHELIGACIDTGDVIRSAEDPVKWIHELGQRVFAVHIKDVEKPHSGSQDVVIGQGHLDVVGMFKALRNLPADGSLAIEYESNPDDPITDIKQCLDVAREAIVKAMG